MAATLSVTAAGEMPNGERYIRGTATVGVYTTGGVVVDCSAYFSGSPTVFLGNDDGYSCEHDRGTAAAGVIVCRVSNSSANSTMPEAANAANLANVVCPIIVMGTPA